MKHSANLINVIVFKNVTFIVLSRISVMPEVKIPMTKLRSIYEFEVRLVE
jgi:hypothetical protein